MAKPIKEQLKNRYDEFYKFEKSRGKTHNQANKIAFHMSNIITFDKVDDLELSPVLLESFVAHGKKHHKFVDEESLSYFDALLNGWRKEFKRQAEGVKKYYVSQGESEKNASEIAKGYLKYIVAFPEEREKLNESSGYRYLNICAMLLNYHDKAPSWTKKIPY